jgi:uncharacterized protein YodC (DUF2158 family)
MTSGGLMSFQQSSPYQPTQRRWISQMSLLKPGDLVVLKSGGPVMTVDAVNTDIFDDARITGVLCAWFVGDKLERARFDRNALAQAPSRETVSERTDARPLEAAGEYKTVLDEMVAAMNGSVDASEELAREPLRKPMRAAAGKDPADATAPAARQ